jgi:O-antigen/teichoic acid export membrane protein
VGATQSLVPKRCPVESDVSAVQQSVPAPHRKHGLSQNLLWALVAEGSMLFASMASVIIVSKHFTTVQYGKYAGIYGIIGFAVASCTSWAALVIPQWIVREQESAPTTMNSTLTYLCLLSVLGMTAVVVLGGLLIKNVSLASIAALAAAELIGGAAVLPLAMLAQSTISVRAGQWVRTSGALAKATALLVLWKFSTVTFVHIGLALLAAQITVWMICSVLIARRLGFFPSPGQPMRHHLATAATFMASVGSYAVNEEGDKPIMAASHFKEDAGLYAIAYRVARLAMVPLAAMESATHTQSVERGSRLSEHVYRARKFTRLGIGYGVLAVIGLNIFGPFMLRVLAPNFSAAITQLRWISPLVLLRGCRNFADNGLLGLGKVRSRMMLNIGSAMLSLTLYIILIPKFSWKGALAATLITEVALVVASWVALHKYQEQENHVLERTWARDRKRVLWP